MSLPWTLKERVSGSMISLPCQVFTNAAISRFPELQENRSTNSAEMLKKRMVFIFIVMFQGSKVFNFSFISAFISSIADDVILGCRVMTIRAVAMPFEVSPLSK